MKCIYLTIRTKKYEKYIYCRKKKSEIEFKDCKSCNYKEFKQMKELKKKSNKLKKLEAKRYSILTENLKVCYICTKDKKDDLHEIFGGSNRQKSMQWGLVIPVCRKCHDEWENNKELRKKIQKEAKEEFIKRNTKEKFRKEFGKNYI
jgi:hypothetical protein|nr:MAG TPA: Recombination enhancement function protein nuclease, DNase, HYDROLASE.4A [Caudoviricetes sp.]